MTTEISAADQSGRDGWVMAGMTIAAASAAVASFAGLRGLALVAGWPVRLAWLLPVTLDAYAMTSARVWLAGTTRARRARRFARLNAIGAITASIAGNAVYHVELVGLLRISWPIVVLVGAVPAAVLGLTSHLQAIRTLGEDESRHQYGTESQDTAAQTGPESRTEDGTGDQPKARTRNDSRRRPKSRTEDELIAAAREADAKYRADHNNRPITRDALRAALKIAGPRATELRRQLAAEDEQSDQSSSPDSPTSIPDREEALTTQ
ncbi:MAG TPA: DUF2637 domain-containing protein [Actinocrinis sp.]|nr:DUF2637 domain-containing protein [Actinocrinis sp.]